MDFEEIILKFYSPLIISPIQTRGYYLYKTRKDVISTSPNKIGVC